MQKGTVPQSHSLTGTSNPYIFTVVAVLNSKLRVTTLSKGGFVSKATADVVKPDGLVLIPLAELSTREEAGSTSKTKHSTGYMSSTHVKEIVTDSPPLSLMLYLKATGGGVFDCVINKTQIELLG